MEHDDWQPAIIASHEHTLLSHTRDPGYVSCFAGRKVRVRRNPACASNVQSWAKALLGCTGEHFQVHDDDAAALWPDILERGSGVTICSCQLLMD